jgi:hypothetical protein
MNDGVFIGVYPGLGEPQIRYVLDVLDAFAAREPGR